jgi:putative oxidoreductase
MNEFWTSWQPKVLSLLRFMAGFLMLWHGTQKLLGFPPTGQPGGQLSALMAVGGIIELVGGVLVMIGLFTRWTSFLLSGMMAVAYWMAHGLAFLNPEGPGAVGFLPLVNRGELAALYCFVFLYLFFAGGGTWSVDNLLKKNE